MLVAIALFQAHALASPRLIESSGVAVSRAHPGVLWSHNDSGDGPYLYATDLTGADRGRVLVSGAENEDWEDMALGPCPTRPGTCVYLADTGDNLERRTTVTVYAVPEPDPPVGPADTLGVTAAAAALRFHYPDGAHDVEAIYVSPIDTALYLVSKGRSGPIRLYRLPRSAWTEGEATATLVERLPITPDLSAGRWVTGAAMRADGARVAIRTYTEVYFFTPMAGGALTPLGRPCSVLGLEPQGEALAFLEDGALVLTSEAARGPRASLHVVRCHD